MNVRTIVAILVILVIFGLMYVFSGNPQGSSKKKDSTDNVVFVPVLEVANKERSFNLEAYGQLTAGQKLDIAFEVSGKLKEGALRIKPGVRFTKGQLLYEIDAEEAKYALSARKSSFITMIVQVLPDIKLDYTNEFATWENFMYAIDEDKALPDLPKTTSKKLKLLLTQRNIFAEYNNIQSQELRLSKYRYYAPFSGTVTEVFLEPGSIVNMGVRISSAMRTSDYELQIPISLKDLKLYKQKGNVQVYDAQNKLVATAQLTRVSDVINKLTQSLDAYFSITPVQGAELYNGMYVNIKLNKETFDKVMALPFLAVKNGKVRALRDSSIVEMPIEIAASIPDTLLVRGLNDGTDVLLNSSEFIADTMKVVGIKK